MITGWRCGFRLTASGIAKTSRTTSTFSTRTSRSVGAPKVAMIAEQPGKIATIQHNDPVRRIRRQYRACPLTIRSQLGDGFAVLELGYGVTVRASIVRTDDQKQTLS